MTDATGASGIVLLECYDASATSGTVPIVNASARAHVGTGDNVLIPSFVVGGDGKLKLLVRAVGPQLAVLGVGDAISDPQITLYNGSTPIATNDNWSDSVDATTIEATAAQVGAFALPRGSKDAAMIVTVPAGAYTAVTSGVNGTTGTALVEVYVVP